MVIGDSRVDQLEHLNRIIQRQRDAQLPESKSENQNPVPVAISIFIYSVISAIFIGRALSCTYRFKTTDDAQRLFLELPFIDLIHESWTTPFIAVFSTSFFITDAFLTNVNLKKSFNEFLKIKKTYQKNMFLLKDPNLNRLTTLNKIQLVLCFLLVTSSAYGSFLKGKVGVNVIVQQIFKESSDVMNTVSLALGYFSGVSSAICSILFQFDQALVHIRIRHALKNDPVYALYKKENRFSICRDYSVSFIITLTMAAITMLSAFYDHGVFEAETATIIKSGIIVTSNIILNTAYTSSPNFYYRTIQNEHEKWLQKNKQLEAVSCGKKLGINSIKAVGMISSTGNSLAALSAVMHIFLLFFGKQSVKEVPLSANITGLILVGMLFFPMFSRDFAYYTKSASSILFGNRKTTEETAPVISVDRDESAQSIAPVGSLQ